MELPYEEVCRLVGRMQLDFFAQSLRHQQETTQLKAQCEQISKQLNQEVAAHRGTREELERVRAHLGHTTGLPR